MARELALHLEERHSPSAPDENPQEPAGDEDPSSQDAQSAPAPYRLLGVDSDLELAVFVLEKPYPAEPFRPVNPAAIPPGSFVAAISIEPDNTLPNQAGTPDFDARLKRLSRVRRVVVGSVGWSGGFGPGGGRCRSRRQPCRCRPGVQPRWCKAAFRGNCSALGWKSAPGAPLLEHRGDRTDARRGSSTGPQGRRRDRTGAGRIVRS